MLAAPPKDPRIGLGGTPNDPTGPRGDGSEPSRPTVRYRLRYRPAGQLAICGRNVAGPDPDAVVGDELPEGARLVSCRPIPW